jgi:hypothetical protein
VGKLELVLRVNAIAGGRFDSAHPFPLRLRDGVRFKPIDLVRVGAATIGAAFIIIHLSQQVIALPQPRAIELAVMDLGGFIAWQRCTLNGMWRKVGR